jgi:hypothetical protein
LLDEQIKPGFQGGGIEYEERFQNGVLKRAYEINHVNSNGPILEIALLGVEGREYHQVGHREQEEDNY